MSDGTHNDGEEYSENIVEENNTITVITTANTPLNLYYYCGNHSNMGGLLFEKKIYIYS